MHITKNDISETVVEYHVRETHYYDLGGCLGYITKSKSFKEDLNSPKAKWIIGQS